MFILTFGDRMRPMQCKACIFIVAVTVEDLPVRRSVNLNPLLMIDRAMQGLMQMPSRIYIISCLQAVEMIILKSLTLDSTTTYTRWRLERAMTIFSYVSNVVISYHMSPDEVFIQWVVLTYLKVADYQGSRGKDTKNAFVSYLSPPRPAKSLIITLSPKPVNSTTWLMAHGIQKPVAEAVSHGISGPRVLED